MFATPVVDLSSLDDVKYHPPTFSKLATLCTLLDWIACRDSIIYPPLNLSQAFIETAQKARGPPIFVDPALITYQTKPSLEPAFALGWVQAVSEPRSSGFSSAPNHFHSFTSTVSY